MNLQTSFLTPPFGFALFYLRSVAAKKDYKDRVTGETIPAVTTAQIYKGSIAFIVLQVAMVAAVITFPTLVTGGIEKGVTIDADKALEQLQMRDSQPKAEPTLQPATGAEPGGSAPSSPGAAPAAPADEKKEDPMRGLLESLKDDQKKKEPPGHPRKRLFARWLWMSALSEGESQQASGFGAR
jgi:hypothetical protein